jgi:hypothetical protein
VDLQLLLKIAIKQGTMSEMIELNVQRWLSGNYDANTKQIILDFLKEFKINLIKVDESTFQELRILVKLFINGHWYASLPEPEKPHTAIIGMIIIILVI